MANSPEEPKIIVDEDWKTQVQREKEQLQQQTGADATPGGSSGDSAAASQSAAASSQPRSKPGQFPPADLTMLIASLATQAVGCMAGLAEEDGQEAEPNLPLAKHYVDLLGVIEEKTQGNLTDDEKQYLQSTLYQLRLAFVSASQNAKS